jgi:hypothetical protein
MIDVVGVERTGAVGVAQAIVTVTVEVACGFVVPPEPVTVNV